MFRSLGAGCVNNLLKACVANLSCRGFNPRNCVAAGGLQHFIHTLLEN